MCWHKYSKWEVTDRGKIVTDGKEVGRMAFQERSCVRCGYVHNACEKTFIYPGY